MEDMELLKAMKDMVDASLNEMSANMKYNQEDLLERLEAKIEANRETDREGGMLKGKATKRI
jgi:hypothetical protein